MEQSVLPCLDNLLPIGMPEYHPLTNQLRERFFEYRIVQSATYAGFEHYHRSSRSENEPDRSEEHTSELQSRFDLVCRLLLEKKQNNRTNRMTSHTHDA